MSGFYSPKPSLIAQKAARALLAHPAPWRIELHSEHGRAAIRDKSDIAFFTCINIAKACLIVKAVNRYVPDKPA